MFKETRSVGGDSRDLSVEELLTKYKYLQTKVGSTIGARNRSKNEEEVYKNHAVYGRLAHEFSLSDQNAVEDGFARLNELRLEIERRGLEAPTMEEKGI